MRGPAFAEIVHKHSEPKATCMVLQTHRSWARLVRCGPSSCRVGIPRRHNQFSPWQQRSHTTGASPCLSLSASLSLSLSSFCVLACMMASCLEGFTMHRANCKWAAGHWSYRVLCRPARLLGLVGSTDPSSYRQAMLYPAQLSCRLASVSDHSALQVYPGSKLTLAGALNVHACIMQSRISAHSRPTP